MINKLTEFTLYEHYNDLRKRIVTSVLCFIALSVICGLYVEEIYRLLLYPLKTVEPHDQSRRLIFTGLTEGFSTYFKLAIYSGILLSFPIIIRQIYLFLSPGLYTDEKRYIKLLLFMAPVLFYTAIFFVYYYIMPITWAFFLSFETSGKETGLPIVLEPKVSEYLDLVLELMLGFGFAFQLPIIILILCNMRIIKVKTLSKIRKYVIVAIFIVAAILTPPDVLSQIALAIPLMILYEISILLCKRIEK